MPGRVPGGSEGGSRVSANERPCVVIMDGADGDDVRFAPLRQYLDDHGVDLRVAVDEQQREALLPTAEVLIVLGRDHLRPDEVATLDHAVGIVCLSVGMDKVPSEAAERGLTVRNVPDYCIDEVSDHALALVLAGQRRLHEVLPAMREGGWLAGRRASDPHSLRRLRGQVMAVVGAGRIGRMVARKARAFGIATLAVDPYLTEDPGPDFPLVALEEALGRADIIVLCTVLTDENHGLIGDEALRLVKPGVMVVNVARGGLIDESALVAALEDGRVRLAALDVRDPEPPMTEDPLRALPGVLETPHMAASSIDAVTDLYRKGADIVTDLLAEAGRLPGTLRSSG